MGKMPTQKTIPPLLHDAPGWKVKSVICRDRGETHRRYYFRRRLAKRVEVKSAVGRQLCGYALIERDLRMVLTWLEEIQDRWSPPENAAVGWQSSELDDPVIQALFVSAMTFYGKCFAKANGRRVKLERSWIPAESLDEHDWVIRMRNNYAAHGGDAGFENVRLALVIPHKNGRVVDKPVLVRELNQMEVAWNIGMSEFIVLAAELQSKVIAKCDELNQKIFEETIKPRGYDYWLRF